MKFALLMLGFIFTFICSVQATEIIASATSEFRYKKQIMGKEFYEGECGPLDQEYAYDRSEHFAIGLKTLQGCSPEFLKKYLRNFGTLIFQGQESALTSKDKKLFKERAKGVWIQVEDLTKWDKKYLESLMKEGGKVIYNGEPLKTENTKLYHWPLQHAEHIQINIQKANWDHEIYLKKFLEKKGSVYYSLVPLEKDFKLFMDSTYSHRITLNSEIVGKMPYKFVNDFKKAGGKIEGENQDSTN